MDLTDILVDGIQRSQEVCHEVVDGLDLEALTWQPAPEANSISWLVWHLARQQDAQITDLAGTTEVWLADGWVDRFDLSLPRESMGYQHTPDEAAAVRAEGTLLLGYLDAAVHATERYLGGVQFADLDEIIDESWQPPVSRGVRIVSIIDDAAQHAGQAAYLRGLLDRSNRS